MWERIGKQFRTEKIDQVDTFIGNLAIKYQILLVIKGVARGG